MDIKSDGYKKKLKSSKYITLVVMVIVGLILMVSAIVIPFIKGWAAIILFLIGWMIFNDPWQKLKEKW